MDNKFNFTLNNLLSLECPAGTRIVRVHDTKINGLALRVTASGIKTYVYYRRLPRDNESPGKMCEINLGRFEDLRLEQARQRAEQLSSIVGLKQDPSIERKPAITYGNIFQQYIEQYARLHTTTWDESVKNHQRHFERFDKMAAEKIRRVDIERWVNDLAEHSGKHAANRNYDIMRAVFSWALKRAIIKGDNPCFGVTRFKTRARERFIKPGDEYARFAKALQEEPSETIRDFFWMCLYTGARRGNVLAMEWNQVDLVMMTWRIPITKNGDSQTIPLTHNALEILRRRAASEKKNERWVFPSDRTGRKTGVLGHLESPKTAWDKLIKRAGITDLRIHDLRRTAGSYMAIQGTSPTIIGKALGHRSLQATAIYARLTYDPVRQALENAQAALADPERLLGENRNGSHLTVANKPNDDDDEEEFAYWAL